MSEILLLDQDGVLADQMGGVFHRLESRGYGSFCHADTTDYWFNGAPFDANTALQIMKEPHFFRDLDVITGAVRAVNRLRERYDVRVCSAPMPGSPDCETDKREWLAQHFDADFAEQAIIVADKSVVNGKAIIEDNPHIKVPYGVIMFDQPWNRNKKGLTRMFNWGDLRVVERTMNRGA